MRRGRELLPPPLQNYGVTVKIDELMPIPPWVSTPTGPVFAPVGTVAVTWVSEFTVNLAGM
jgi:hypothetical protein